MIPLNKKFICPYCGYIDSLYNFLIKKKDGSLSTKIVKCQMCENRMKKITLTSEMSIYEWGLWLYLCIRLYDVYDKINFRTLYRALHLMGGENANDFKSGFDKGKEVSQLEGHTGMKRELQELEFKYLTPIEKKSRTKLNNYA